MTSTFIRSLRTALLVLLATVRLASADIYEWEYVNPGNPSEGVRQSSIVVPGGAGRDAMPEAYLDNLDLTKAYFRNANLREISFSNSKLLDADFTGAEIRGAGFGQPGYAKRLTAVQLYSTASYQGKDLSGVGLALGNLTNWDFSGQKLTNTSFHSSFLNNANFSGADIRGATF